MSGDRRRIAWRHRFSLRLRITLLAALVVAVVVAVGGVVILVALRAELHEGADEVGKMRAEDVAELASAGSPPEPLPVMEDPETFVEVVSKGRLVTATADLDATNLFELPEQDVGEIDVVEIDRLPLDEAGPYRVTSYGAATARGPMTVFVAVSVEDIEDTLAAAARIGTIGLSILVLVLASVMWFAIGRALAPVDAIRVRADAITGQNLESRVPEPARHDEIGRLARTVNQMLERLQDSAERQRRFVADAAHELRSPIASLRTQLETAQDGATTRAREGDLLLETLRMESLVDQLLLLARADSEAPWVRPRTMDLDDVVDTAIASIPVDERVVIDASAVTPMQVSGDAELLEQVVRNLVQNAVRHARQIVTVTVSPGAGDTALVTVDDDGHGVPEDRRDDIFGRFVRLDDSRDRDQGGVGLGLAIVAEIVHAHGGAVSVSTSPSGGARFVVELPRGSGSG